ncbi:hypothetical protein EJD97_018887 [Solanum chilense]|uniref:C2H2-type domain-containing protein n=1 Tax=Solanum chilense TaxID=4083 RepID=A0A6N2AFP5_SOLCI|nr:hypothetical protein EJD97_018887 [Solanum chilense]
MNMRFKKSKVEESVENFAMANCVDIAKRNELLGRSSKHNYECKKCKKRFVSFQALGGHATSHKNKLNMMMSTNNQSLHKKKHECSICGKEYSTGQALGGHMRKHRNELNQIEQNKKKIKLEESTKTTLNLDLNLSIWE